MPVSVVIGGQFGSEGKGKVSHFLAGEMRAAAVVRVGGPNSGHTVIRPDDRRVIFRQLPTAAILAGVKCVLPAGSYLDVDLLLAEMRLAEVARDCLWIDPHAVVISDDDRQREAQAQLRERIGSTLSGTGAALARRVARESLLPFAKNDPRLTAYLRPTTEELRHLLREGHRIIIEGTQGFGLSLLHGEYPNVTSRDTTAAAFVAEAGLSPIDIDDIVLVIRAFPIRVAGNSGPLPNEIDWATITKESGSPVPIVEYTSATNRMRRVARFEPDVVQRAMLANAPTRVVLNHLDYLDSRAGTQARATDRVLRFVREVEGLVHRRIDYLGFSAKTMVPAVEVMQRRAG
jgi:adenylosuccinate synthase